MPTSAAGTSTDTRTPRPRRAPAGPPGRGFTLLEILTVLVIVGVMLSFATLSMRGDPRLDLLRDEADRLLALMRLARDEAALGGRELGLRFEPDGYVFLTRGREGWGEVTGDSLLRARRLPPELRLDVLVDRAASRPGRRPGGRPDVVLWPSGEVTPFRAVLRLAEGEASYVLDARFDGNLRLERAAEGA